MLLLRIVNKMLLLSAVSKQQQVVDECVRRSGKILLFSVAKKANTHKVCVRAGSTK